MPATIDRFSERVRHIEVNATHLGMGFNPTIWGHVVSALESSPARPGGGANPDLGVPRVPPER